jgi:hypothetical protein
MSIVHVGLYLQDIGLEGGQGVILHLPRPVVHQVGLHPVLGVRNNGDILRAGNIAICCFF